MLLQDSNPLGELIVWNDSQARSAAMNMALDEVLLTRMRGPWLRQYGWDQPSISIGFSQALTKVPDEKQTWPLVRRWTGGGVVVHDGDWTYTLGVPAEHPFSDEKAAEIYRWIHEKLIQAFDYHGMDGATLQPNHTSDGMGVCFIEPAKYDVVWHDKKIAGAAQRRNKIGLMHQGTVQAIPIPEGYLKTFSEQMCPNVTYWHNLPEEWVKEAEVLAIKKYASDAWTLEKSYKA